MEIGKGRAVGGPRCGQRPRPQARYQVVHGARAGDGPDGESQLPERPSPLGRLHRHPVGAAQPERHHGGHGRAHRLIRSFTADFVPLGVSVPLRRAMRHLSGTDIASGTKIGTDGVTARRRRADRRRGGGWVGGGGRGSTPRRTPGRGRRPRRPDQIRGRGWCRPVRVEGVARTLPVVPGAVADKGFLGPGGDAGRHHRPDAHRHPVVQADDQGIGGDADGYHPDADRGGVEGGEGQQNGGSPRGPWEFPAGRP